MQDTLINKADIQPLVVYMFSGDATAARPDSRTFQRLSEYARLAGRLVILVKTNEHSAPVVQGAVTSIPVGGPVWLWPLRALFATARHWRTLAQAEKQVALITAQDPFLYGVTATLAGLLLQRPVEVQIHADISSKAFYRRLRHRLLRPLLRMVLPRASLVRVVSTGLRTYVHERYGTPLSRIYTAPLPVHVPTTLQPDYLKATYPQFDVVFLTVSRLEPEKNIDFIIQAFKELVGAHPRAGLVVAGTGSEAERLQRLASDCPNIVFLGAVEHVANLYQGADCFVQASSFEGYGISVLEAASFGLAIISTPVGVVGDILVKDEDCLVVDLAEPRTFGGALVRIYTDAALRSNLGSKAKLKYQQVPIDVQQRVVSQWQRAVAATGLPKLCMVLPSVSPETHFVYVAELAESLAHHAQVRVLLEKKTEAGMPDGQAEYIAQRFAKMPFRGCELFWLLLRARLQGYRKFYVHYSFIGAFFSAVVTRLFGGRVYYWNAGLPWLYKRNVFRELGERMVYKIVQHLVTATEGLKKLYALHYRISAQHIVVIPNWIDTASVQAYMALQQRALVLARYGLPTDKKVVLFVHRLSGRKGAHVLKDIIPTAAECGAYVVVAGGGPLEGELRQWARAANVEHAVKFLSWVSHEQVTDLFTVADVFVLPSEEEGFPHVLLESMAAGVPFVSFAVGGIPDIVKNDLRRASVPAGNVKAFIYELRVMLALTSAERAALAIQLRNNALQYDKTVVVKQFVQKIVT